LCHLIFYLDNNIRWMRETSFWSMMWCGATAVWSAVAFLRPQYNDGKGSSEMRVHWTPRCSTFCEQYCEKHWMANVFQREKAMTIFLKKITDVLQERAPHTWPDILRGSNVEASSFSVFHS
jgi:hypothetical protein